jgi:hypothetical protein
VDADVVVFTQDSFLYPPPPSLEVLIAVPSIEFTLEVPSLLPEFFALGLHLVKLRQEPIALLLGISSSHWRL